jgi:hypothetical protein
MTETCNLIILSLYIAPSGDVNKFLSISDATLNICTIQNLSYNLLREKHKLFK